MNQNGSLPDYLIIHTEAGWHITDRHGNLPFPFTQVKIRVATMIDMLTQAGASYLIIDPQQRLEEVQQKGKP